jgi:hypothetical protein
MNDGLTKISSTFDPYDLIEYWRSLGQSFNRIAREVPFRLSNGVEKDGGRVLTGRELKKWFDAETIRRSNEQT